MHVPYEGPGVIADWVWKNDHSLHYTRLYKKDALPDASSLDMLIVMGGPMNVFDFLRPSVQLLNYLRCV